jgi:hypothetical protein
MSIRGWGCYLIGGETKVATLAAARVLKAYSKKGIEGVTGMYQSPPSVETSFEEAAHEALKVQVNLLVNDLHHDAKRLIVRLAELRCRQVLGIP